MIFALTTLLSVVGLVTSNGETHNKILNFPTASTANYISFNPDLPELTGLTVCAWKKNSFLERKTGRYWFSYAVSESDNEIIVGDSAFYVKSAYVYSQVPLTDQWVHNCATWDSECGVAVISIDGEAAATQENLKKGESLRAGGNLVIGQEQDSVGGGFDADQAYVGELYNINVWDYALDSTDVASLYQAGLCGYGSTEEDPVISYADILAQELVGDVTVVDGACADIEVPCQEYKEECWETEEKIKYTDGGKLGYIVGTVDQAKAACNAHGECKTLTCLEKKGKMRCELRSSFEKAKKDKKKTSYTYRC
ncbi:C-reactive protein-like [Bolinopsis microptera]|uniref:C-reactive protein-like n=1 Tax=Bolinopsis microptera TaxID=2820187 RepID=UPI003079E3F6